MIQGRKKIELSISTVLERTTPAEIYKHFFGDFEPNQVTCNKYRGDKSPSFVIGNKYGELSHFDYGASDYWKGDCFAFVKQLNGNNLSLDEVLRLIDRELNLGIVSGSEVRNTPTTQLNEPKITKRNTLIQVITRKFLKSELDWWNAYYQDIEDLKKEEVYSIKKAYLNKKLLNLDELRFAYYYNGFFKIYQPLAPKRQKWISNCPLTTSWGLENLSKDKNTVILKSKKDYMVAKKIYPYIAGVQNESLAAFSKEFVQKVKENSKVVFYGGDSDEAGKRASYQITANFGFKHINPPDNLFDCCKDFADMGRYKGLEAVNNHFKIKGVYE